MTAQIPELLPFSCLFEVSLAREPGGERVEPGIHLRSEDDFKVLEYESVLGLHGVVMREGFFDELAYRLDRNGRPGYRDVYALDPEEELRASRRISLR